jgi:protein-S-isoprenylcysteine O-methyltransferase Ste14
MATVEALDAGDITKVGVIVIVALVVIGALLSLVITALIGRLIILVIVLVLGIFVWQQRTHVKDQINSHKCDLNATFFGIHLDAPDSVRAACNKA